MSCDIPQSKLLTFVADIPIDRRDVKRPLTIPVYLKRYEMTQDTAAYKRNQSTSMALATEMWAVGCKYERLQLLWLRHQCLRWLTIVICCLHVRESLFTAIDSAPVKQDSEFTNDRNRYWKNSRCGNLLRFGTIITCFLQNDRNSTLRRPWQDQNNSFLEYYVFLPIISIEPRTGK